MIADPEGQYLGDAILAAEKAPDDQPQRPARQGQADKVQERDACVKARRGDAEEVGAVEPEDALHREPGMRRHLGNGGQRVRDRQDSETAVRPDLLDHHRGDFRRSTRGHQQRQVEPGRAQPFAPLDEHLVGPDGGDRGQRGYGDQQGQPVGYLHPGQHGADQKGDPPLPRGPVEHQPGQQQGRLGADVVGLEDQDEHAGAELRRDHDPGSDEHPHDALAAGGTPPGQHRAGEHDQRVGDSRRHVQHVRVQAAEVLDEHVLGQFGRVERHVGDGPAAQQGVAVQHVPGLQRIGRAIRTDARRPRDVQVAEVEPDPDGDQAGQPGQPDQPRDPPPPAALARGAAPAPASALISAAGPVAAAGLASASGAGLAPASGAGLASAAGPTSVPGPASVPVATSAPVSVSATATAEAADSSSDRVDMLPQARSLTSLARLTEPGHCGRPARQCQKDGGERA